MSQNPPSPESVTSNLVPVDWITVAAHACGETPARCDVLVKRGHRGSPMALHSETPEMTIDGPEGPAILAADYWTRAHNNRAKGDEAGRYFYMLAVHVHGADEAEETGWHEIKSDQVSELADTALGDSGAAFAWKCNAQLHNVLMRNHHATASILERLGSAGNQQIEAVQKAMAATEAGALKALEAERAEYDIARDELEMQQYGQMFREWLGHMREAKAMNTDGPTITAPSSLPDAAGALRDSLTVGQLDALREIVGEEQARDTTLALLEASTAKDPEAAAAIVRTILMKLAPHQAELARVFAPPIVPPNIAAYQSACLRVLQSVVPLH